MKIRRFESDGAVVSLSTHELAILNNALNEVCNGLDIAEFSTRMGAELEEAEGLLNQIGKAIRSLKVA
ncbi:MAG: hypothetical protein L0177_03955 [Chloroflexi bacterium]|nr:hypothetical protein [Chloroflexota bacterium]